MDIKESMAHLTAGSIAGAAQIVVGHPFDTVKVWLVADTLNTSGAAPNHFRNMPP
jgi:hypothetical protein